MKLDPTIVNAVLSQHLDRKTKEVICKQIALLEWERRIKEVEEKISTEYTESALRFHQDWKRKRKRELTEVELEVEGIKSKLGV